MAECPLYLGRDSPGSLENARANKKDHEAITRKDVSELCTSDLEINFILSNPNTYLQMNKQCPNLDVLSISNCLQVQCIIHIVLTLPAYI